MYCRAYDKISITVLVLKTVADPDARRLTKSREISMNTDEAATSSTKEFPENEINKETNNPFAPMTREEIIEQLSAARNLAEKGMILEAHEVSRNIRKKYGL